VRSTRDLGEQIVKGILSAPVETVYPIDEIKAALAHAQRGERSGKILVASNGRSKSEGHDMANFTLRVNGERRTVAVEPDTPLLYILRNDLELNGPKFGCGLAQCGACTVLVDGKPVRSCVAPVSSVAKGHITTIEGLGTVEALHPLQRAFTRSRRVSAATAVAAW